MDRAKSIAMWTALALVMLVGLGSLVESPYQVVRPLDSVSVSSIMEVPREEAQAADDILFPLVDSHRAKWTEYFWYRVRGHCLFLSLGDYGSLL